MTRMERLSALYSRLSGVAGEPNPELNQYFDHFRRLDFGSVYPLLLALYEDYEDGQFALSEFVASLGILSLVHPAPDGRRGALEFTVRRCSSRCARQSR